MLRAPRLRGCCAYSTGQQSTTEAANRLRFKSYFGGATHPLAGTAPPAGQQPTSSKIFPNASRATCKEKLQASGLVSWQLVGHHREGLARPSPAEQARGIICCSPPPLCCRWFLVSLSRLLLPTEHHPERRAWRELVRGLAEAWRLKPCAGLGQLAVATAPVAAQLPASFLSLCRQGACSAGRAQCAECQGRRPPPRGAEQSPSLCCCQADSPLQVPWPLGTSAPLFLQARYPPPTRTWQGPAKGTLARPQPALQTCASRQSRSLAADRAFNEPPKLPLSARKGLSWAQAGQREPQTHRMTRS